MRVELRGREALVAQQFLDNAQIGSALEQVRRVRVSQGVRTHVTSRDPVI